MPLSVHQALSAFENNKSAVVNTEVGRLREATQLMNRYVSIPGLALLKPCFCSHCPDDMMGVYQISQVMSLELYFFRMYPDVTGVVFLFHVS